MPELRDRAARTEELRRLPPETERALHEAGLFRIVQPKRVGVILEASHQCVSTRGVHKAGVEMVTSRMLGTFRSDPSTRREFLSIVNSPTSVSVANT